MTVVPKIDAASKPTPVAALNAALGAIREGASGVDILCETPQEAQNFRLKCYNARSKLRKQLAIAGTSPSPYDSLTITVAATPAADIAEGYTHCVKLRVPEISSTSSRIRKA